MAHAEPGGDKPNLRLHEIWFASWMRRIILGTHPGCDFMCVMCSVSCLRFETYAFQVLCYKSHPGPWYANTRHKHVTHIPFGGLSGFAALGTPWDLLKAFRVLTFMGNEYRPYLCQYRSTAHRSTTPGALHPPGTIHTLPPHVSVFSCATPPVQNPRFQLPGHPKSIKSGSKKDSKTEHFKMHQFHGPGPSQTEKGLEKGAPDGSPGVPKLLWFRYLSLK